ncbi:unnamed protein product [Anisakis simplex]|uniref:Paired box protein Pax-4 (inferred by orthology to a human protein) n=1 Tax=Anisakis simplex TaxID=6269 RepID=A0A0M3JRR5_ANISI|nr:unnamed protein product [Anisakis simplex]
MADFMHDEKHFVIDMSTPESLERDFYAWLNGDFESMLHHSYQHNHENAATMIARNNHPSTNNSTANPERLPPIDDFAFAIRESISSNEDLLSDGGSVTDSSPSSISSDGSNEFIRFSNSTDQEQPPTRNSEQTITCPGRSSGTNQLGRTYSPGLPLSMSEREQIVDLYKKGWKICDISKRLCVTHSCVSKILNRYRTTGSVRPKDAKEGRTESPLVIAIRDYRARLGMSRQSEIREQLIADGICSRENAPSRSSINQLTLLPRNNLFAYRIPNLDIKQLFPCFVDGVEEPSFCFMDTS